MKRYFSFRTVFGTIVLIIFVSAYWQWLAYNQFLTRPLNFSGLEKTLAIHKGQSINRLINQLHRQGVIQQPYFVKLYYWLNPQFTAIKAGEYQLEDGETVVSLLDKLSAGSVIRYSFTIVEGANTHQLLSALATRPELSHDISFHPMALVSQLALTVDHIEGMFYPDTYYFNRGYSVLALLKRANQRMLKVLTEEWRNRAENLPYKTPYEALIMASIIEKETGISSERNKIAGVFVRRLKKNMRLQTDPTVIYGIGSEFNGDITYRDLKTKTPYNTYVIKGLPPTPIALPSRASIRAALHPDEGDALYFVASGDGGHQFSRTLSEHNKAVERYQRRNKN